MGRPRVLRPQLRRDSLGGAACPSGDASMTLVVLFGPPAVGKMTVGLELQQLTGLRLFHNHMTVDLVLQFFPFGEPPFRRLVSEFRTRLCQ